MTDSHNMKDRRRHDEEQGLKAGFSHRDCSCWRHNVLLGRLVVCFKDHRGRPSLSHSQIHYLAEVEDYNATHSEYECTLVYGGSVDDHDPNREPSIQPPVKHLPHGDRDESGVAR
jgi:hypothetical protein